MKNPLISVIIDNYNYANFLHDAIQSVFAQKNFSDFEIIVVDDYSTDHSKEIIASYGDRITSVCLPSNKGQGNAFNAGFQLSCGEWICFLDADDLFLEDKLFKVAQAAAANPDATLIYNQGYYANKDLVVGEIFPLKLREGNLRKKLYKTSETLLPPTSFLTFNRKFLKKVLPMEPLLTRIDADFPLQIWASALGKIVALKEPLGLYRLHGDNWFTNTDFLNLDLEMLHHLMRRTEKAFYYINSRAEELNIKPISLMKQRFYLRNLFIFGYLKLPQYILKTIINRNFNGLRDQWSYFKFGLNRRRQFNYQEIE